MKIPAMTILPDHIVRALYLTLVHSLWQGLILALLTAAIVAGTRRSAPAIRYNLLTALLSLFALTGILTFFQVLGQADKAAAVPAMGFKAREASGLWTSLLSDFTLRRTLPLTIASFFDRNAGNIVLIWLLVIGFRSLRLLLGLGGLYRLKHTAVFPADAGWQQRVRELAEEMGIRSAVRLAISGMTRVPMVIGHLKPLILVPAGLMAMLPPTEVEAILIHELAHIRRRDYLVNLLQTIMDILYFFNPAVWWISSLMRMEREHCCDEIAVLRTRSKRNYIQALVSCQEYQLDTRYAVAINGHKDHLKSRVKRILSSSNTTLNRFEKGMLAICLTAIAILSATFFHRFHNRSIAHTQRSAAQVKTFPSVPTLPEGQSPSAPDIATEAEPVPPAGPAAAADKQEKSFPVASAANTMLAASPEPVAATADPAPSVQVRNNYRAYIDDKITVASPVIIDLRRQVPINHRQSDKQQERGQPVHDLRQKAEMDKAGAEQYNLQIKEGTGATAGVSPVKQEVRTASATDEIIASLEREGIIVSNSEKLTFTLSNENFTVNGTRQPAKIFLKYRDQYIAITGNSGQWEVSYRRS